MLKKAKLLSISFILSILLLYFTIGTAFALTSFGYDSVGGSNGTVGSNNIIACNFTLTENANVTSISAYRYTSSYGAKYKYAIFDTATLAYKANTTEGTDTTGGTWGWYSLTITGGVLLNAGTYLLCQWSNGAGELVKYTTGATNQMFNMTQAYAATWPTTLTVGTYYDRKNSIYANYTVTTPPDTTKPTYALINTSTVIPAQICIFSCNWTDETALSGYIFGTNNTGSWINETWITMTSWANVTKTLNATDAFVVQFEWWANDTSNNWNNTGVQSITLTSTDVLPYLAMGGILGGTGVLAIFLIRKKKDG